MVLKKYFLILTFISIATLSTLAPAPIKDQDLKVEIEVEKEVAQSIDPESLATEIKSKSSLLHKIGLVAKKYDRKSSKWITEIKASSDEMWDAAMKFKILLPLWGDLDKDFEQAQALREIILESKRAILDLISSSQEEALTRKEVLNQIYLQHLKLILRQAEVHLQIAKDAYLKISAIKGSMPLRLN